MILDSLENRASPAKIHCPRRLQAVCWIIERMPADMRMISWVDQANLWAAAVAFHPAFPRWSCTFQAGRLPARAQTLQPAKECLAVLL